MSEWNWNDVPEHLIEELAPRQKQAVTLTRGGASRSQAAKEMGLSGPPKVTSALRDAQKRIARLGWTPHSDSTRFVDPGQQIKGKSTLTKDDEGNLVWIKTDRDTMRQEAFAKAVESLTEGIKPFKRVKAPSKVNSELLTNYCITDFHLGMYAWALETGADWDMEIAESVLLNAISEMMDASPDSEVAVFSQMGDLLHWDGLLAVTPQNKHVLDADTRFDLLVECAMNVCAKAIEMLLHKHKKVHVIHCEGNHDMASSVWLRRCTQREFRNNPRVTVESSPFPFYHYVWGKTFLGFHHGHLQKMEQLPLVFSTDPKFRQDFGMCDYAYIKTGHRHQKEVIEKGGIIVEQLETLAARDAYAARGFPYSQRGTIAVTYSKTHGEVSRVTVRPKV